MIRTMTRSSRTCWDAPTSQPAPLGSTRSSPHMRGYTIGGQRRGDGARTLTTHAGIRPWHPQDAFSTVSRSRTCGDVPICRTYRPVTKRSFPHVRGYSRCFVELHVVERFPPAYAGIHSHLTYPYRLHQPPSRTCGDAADFHVHRESRALPLPRMRGCTSDQR